MMSHMSRGCSPTSSQTSVTSKLRIVTPKSNDFFTHVVPCFKIGVLLVSVIIRNIIFGYAGALEANG